MYKALPNWIHVKDSRVAGQGLFAKDDVPEDVYLGISHVVVEGETCLDVTRSEKMMNIFDMYYDRYGKDAVQKIDYGAGAVRPNLWGVKATPPKKGKKRK